VVAVTLAAFLPALGNGFTNWDDNVVITGNEQVAAWSFGNTGRIFTSFHYGLYHPLVTLSFAAEHRLFGFSPYHFHLDNLLIHAANTLLVFALILMIGGDLVAAVVTALLFGIHPTRVESVAWAMERKDVLYAFFFFASLLLYLRTNGNRRLNPDVPTSSKAGIPKHYIVYCNRDVAVSISSFVCSLLAKAAAITLPFVLLLLDLVRRRGIDRANLRGKVPYFLLAAIFGVVAVLARIFSGELTRDPPFGAANIFIGSYRLIFYYLARIVWPWGDYALYPGNSFAAKNFISLPWFYLLAPVLLILLGLLFHRLFRRDRQVMFCGAFFLVTLLPALGLISVGPFADRFTYVPAVGIFYLFGLAVARLARRRSVAWRGALWGILLLLTIALLSATRQQCGVWRDGVSLWNRACQKYPRSIEALTMRGFAYAEQGDFERSVADLGKAIRLAPRRADVYNNRGIIYGRRGETAKALWDFDQALRLKPDDPAAKHNRQNVIIILNSMRNFDRIKP